MLRIVSTLSGALYDAAIVRTGLVPAGAGGLSTPGGQFVNVDLFHPSLVFGNSGTSLINLRPFPSGGYLVPVAGTQPASASIQMAVVDPSSADGYRLSQGAELDVVPPGSMPGPTGDDTFLEVVLPNGPLFGPQAVPFYGTAYSTMYVGSNGRLTFGVGSTDFTPTVSEALSGPPFVGYWTDLSPNQGGTITITSLGTGVRVTWTAVNYFSEAATVSFSIEICGACGAIRLDNLLGIMPNPVSSGMVTGGDRIFFGISGGAGATDGGNTMFLPGASGTPATATDMIYDFYDPTLSGLPAIPQSLAARTLGAVLLTPTGSSYIWAGF
jgi:hypothetical protein